MPGVLNHRNRGASKSFVFSDIPSSGSKVVLLTDPRVNVETTLEKVKLQGCVSWRQSLYSVASSWHCGSCRVHTGAGQRLASVSGGL